MAEVIVRINAVLTDSSGLAYAPQVCGRAAEDGLWEGWIEFVPLRGGTVQRTPRETEQSTRADLAYWATGLSATYLEGALERALGPRAEPGPASAEPAYDGPAPAPAKAGSAQVPPSPATARAVLDPFKVYRQGADTLHRELLALDPAHLRAVIRAHALVDEGAVDIGAMTRGGLAELVVAAVRRKAG